ncbi:MAG: DUF1080 domain-containing protein [Bacteroidales bacterium]
MKIIYYVSLVILIFMISGFQLTSANYADNEKAKNILENGLSYFNEPHGSWNVKNKQLILETENPKNRRTNIWLNEDYDDFLLELEFKLNPGTNSGVFFRTSDINNPVQTGIEVQIKDDYGRAPIDKHFCGSIYDIREVSKNRVKKPGKWNQLKIICDGSLVQVHLNNRKVIDMDLSDWEEAGKNPDGTKNKFNTAYKDLARKGKIGFQDHGGIVRFRNLKIQKL